MPVPEQERIIASLKQQMYSGTPEEITKDLLERVKEAWQDHGFLRVAASGSVQILTARPAPPSIWFSAYLDEGPQYKLGGIAFENNRAIANLQAVRSRFPIKDGDIFSRQKIGRGLERLRAAYGQLGYINFTAVPSTNVDEENRLIYLSIDCNEGEQFYLSDIRVAGFDPQASQDVADHFLLRPGDVYNQRLVGLSVNHLSVPNSNASASYKLQIDATTGTVAITISFAGCPGQ